MEELKSTQAEMNTIVTERRMRTALYRSILRAAYRQYKCGKDVLLYSKEEKKWISPFIVVNCTGQIITTTAPDKSKRKTIKYFQIKLSIREQFAAFITFELIHRSYHSI